MKRFLPMILLIFIVLVFSACGGDEVYSETTQAVPSAEMSTTQNHSNTDTTKPTNGAVLFSTEYDIEDYVENAIVISKNDQLLYGLLDSSGTEIIPVRYDKMEIINKEDYISGLCNAYIWAKFENTEYIFDLKGNTIAESENKLSYINYLIKPTFDKNVAIFSETTDDSIILYNSDYHQLISIKNYLSVEFISKNICLITDLSYSFTGSDYSESTYYKSDIDGVALLNFTENTFEKLASNNVPAKTIATKNDYFIVLDSKILSINEEGNILKEQSFDSFYDAYTFATEQQSSLKKYNLYESNSTWKMEDLNGNTLYHERYYAKYHYEGENNCIFLTNEDNYLCGFGRQGNLYIEFGEMILENDEFYLYGMYEKEKVIKIHEGKESIIVVTTTSTGYRIHYFCK